MRVNFRVFGLVFLFGLLVVHETSRSQTISLGPADSKSITAFNPASKTFYRVWPDSIRAFFSPEFKSSTVTEIKNPTESFPLGYKPVFIRDTLFFVDHSGGLLYRLNTDSLVREDRSFKHQMQINSNVFVRNDTIFKFGGYGFWSARNFFTYFSFDSHEWEILAPYGSKMVPPGSHSGDVTQKDSLLYVFSGHTVYRANPLKTDAPFKEVWSFNIKLHKWNYLGIMEEGLSTVYPGKSARNPGIQMGDRILTQIDRRFAVINPSKNLISYYKIAQKYFMIPMFENPSIASFYADGFFYILSYNSVHGQKITNLTLEVVPENELLMVKLDETPLYTDGSFNLKYTIVFLVSSAIIFILWFGRIRTKHNRFIYISDYSVSYRRKNIEMESGAVKILKALVRSRGELSSQEVLLLSENPELSEAHNLKIKNQLIDSINLRLKALVGEQIDFITSSKSTEDRRLKSYKVDYKRFKIR